jgi:hypothetical protein
VYPGLENDGLKLENNVKSAADMLIANVETVSEGLSFSWNVTV